MAITCPRKNYFLGRWIRHGGFYPDRKLRLFRRGLGRFGERPVHEVVQVDGPTATLNHALVHNAYPTLEGYIQHMNRYSSLGAEIAVAEGRGGFSLLNIVINPLATFLYNYFLRLGLLDGREGLLLHLYHSAYVSWKYAKAWELGGPRNHNQNCHPEERDLSATARGSATEGPAVSWAQRAGPSLALACSVRSAGAQVTILSSIASLPHTFMFLPRFSASSMIAR